MSNNPASLFSQPISRRAALKLFGVGGVAGLIGYSRFSKPEPNIFQKDTLELPRRLSQPKSVVVVGGGLAGLATAYELSQRGFVVTLVERSPQLGGKIASWPIQVGEDQLMMEHGFHGFFPQYYNLKSLVDELSISDNFLSLDSYAVVYKGDQYGPEIFRPNHSAFPWNVVDLAIASPNMLNWGLNLTKKAHWEVFREITSFNPQKTYQRLDHLSVADWIKNDFPRGLYDLYFLPFAKSSLNSPDVLSAGELMQFFHFYFFGNPEGLAFEGTKQDMGTSLVQPIANSIVAKGGQILTDTTISQVHWHEGKVESLTYQEGSGGSSVPFWVSRNDSLSSPMDHGAPEVPSAPTFYGAGDQVYATISHTSEAISLTCTHQGCTVHQEANGEFHCPCHGAVFSAEGKVLRGPAQRDLPRFKVAKRKKTVAQDEVQLIATTQSTSPLPSPSAKTLTADYYVFAADVPGIKQLFNLSTGEVDSKVNEQVQKLAVADPFAVARFWFDRDFPWEYSHFTSLSGYRLTDSISLYHRIQTDYKEWAERTGGSVVELHAYCYKEKEFPTQQSILATFQQELYDIVPDLQNATLLHRELVNQKNFAGFPPNSYANRPGTSTTIPNLLFAGDWVKMPFPCGLMERAVSSGLLAANTLIQQEGLQRRTLFTVMPEGVLSALTPTEI